MEAIGLASPARLIGIVLVAIGLFFAVVALFQWLWNITVPDVFGLRQITYWQSFRLLILAAILFGGLRAGT